MKLHDPSTLTGLEVETCSVSLGELMMCVRKAVARFRLIVSRKRCQAKMLHNVSELTVNLAPGAICWYDSSILYVLNIVSVCSLYQDVSFQVQHIQGSTGARHDAAALMEEVVVTYSNKAQHSRGPGSDVAVLKQRCSDDNQVRLSVRT